MSDSKSSKCLSSNVKETEQELSLAIANRSRVSCAYNTSRASIVTLVLFESLDAVS